MNVYYNVKKTEPAKLKYRQKRKKKPRKKGRAKQVTGIIIEGLVILAIATAFIYATFFL